MYCLEDVELYLYCTVVLYLSNPQWTRTGLCIRLYLLHIMFFFSSVAVDYSWVSVEREEPYRPV